MNCAWWSKIKLNVVLSERKMWFVNRNHECNLISSLISHVILSIIQSLWLMWNKNICISPAVKLLSRTAPTEGMEWFPVLLHVSALFNFLRSLLRITLSSETLFGFLFIGAVIANTILLVAKPMKRGKKQTEYFLLYMETKCQSCWNNFIFRKWNYYFFYRKDSGSK